MEGDHIYIAIDLKSFYASVECVERKFDPLSTNLVVADPSRTEKTICLAVTPSLKAYGISGRARLFEVVQRVKEVNAERLARAIREGKAQRDEKGNFCFVTSSFDAKALAEDPSLELGYFVAPPRMKLYEQYSAKIFSIYTKYISPEDIVVYSIDEIFADATRYLKTHRMTARELAMTMIREVLYTTGVTATAGIGTNLYLAKVAMDIVAKHVPATARRLEKLSCYTMGDVARLSETNEDALYAAMGINAELLIDHAWGWEPTTIPLIKQYKPQSSSLSSGQVLKEPYSWEKGRLIVQEMTELLSLDLVRQGLVTKKVELSIGYDRESLQVLIPGKGLADTVYAVKTTGRRYAGKVGLDYYGRPSPQHAHGTGNLDRWTNSTRRIRKAILEIFDRTVDPDLLIRRVNIAAAVLPEKDAPREGPEQLDLFTDYEALEKQRAEEQAADEKERRMQQTTLLIQQKYGKNAVLKGMNFLEGGTTIERNAQIGGHRSGE